jgi:hypothetical protein
MPSRYLELEALRLTDLVTEWLEYEAARVAFDVAETEVAAPSILQGLPSISAWTGSTGSMTARCW